MITPSEAVELLATKRNDAVAWHSRQSQLKANGYPAYTTQIGWIGYDDAKIRQLCRQYLAQGFTAFKLKVGCSVQRDIERCRIVREEIGAASTLMVDANQVWDVEEAIAWMRQLAQFDLLWIEEPTSPDDVLGHARIAEALAYAAYFNMACDMIFLLLTACLFHFRPLGIGVATGEMCANRVMFKQFMQAGAMQFCQIDSCRLGGVNEILAVYLMAAKLNGRYIF